jgi:hypothetical protein
MKAAGSKGNSILFAYHFLVTLATALVSSLEAKNNIIRKGVNIYQNSRATQCNYRTSNTQIIHRLEENPIISTVSI